MTAVKWPIWTSRVISYTIGMRTCGIQGAKIMASYGQVGCPRAVAPIAAYDKILGDKLLLSNRTKAIHKDPDMPGGRQDRGPLPRVRKDHSERCLHTGVCVWDVLMMSLESSPWVKM